MGSLLFVTAISFICLRASAGYMGGIKHGLLPLTGLLFMFIGNLMYSIKPNYFAGIRLPWTLSSDDNWRATHKVGGIVLAEVDAIVAVRCNGEGRCSTGTESNELQTRGALPVLADLSRPGDQQHKMRCGRVDELILTCTG